MKFHTVTIWECHLIQQGSASQVNDDLALSIAVLSDVMFGMCIVESLNIINHPYYNPVDT